VDSPRAVAITGYGVFSCFGCGTDGLRKSVFHGLPGFREVDRFPTAGRRSSVAATAPGSPKLADVLETAGRDALALAGLRAPVDAAVLLGTQGAWQGLTGFWRGTTPVADPDAIAGTHADRLAHRLGLGGHRRVVFTNACVSSVNAVAYGADLIRSGREDVVLAGGGYLVDEEFFAKFDSGRAFATDGRLRPFSAERSGLLLGDGVAVLVLEPLAAARARGAAVLAMLAGAALSADSHHVCRPHPEGTGLARAAARAIERAGLRPDDIDYVNAHGTGTAINDPAETAALHQVFAANVPPVSSTKSTTGHCLEGAGALEAVVCLLALDDQLIPPTAGWTTADPACDVDCVPDGPRPARLDAVLSLSLAFGGANAGLVLVRAA
jgi:3-oxoacyl-[acyl-carrier-protein] synthase II